MPPLSTAELTIMSYAVQKHPEPIYGYELRDVFSDREVAQGHVYRWLGKLSASGFLTSSENDQNNNSGPSRRIYNLTSSGLEELQKEIEWREHLGEKVAEHFGKKG